MNSLRIIALLATIVVAAPAFAGSLPILKYRALDNSGNAISGAKLCTYEDGTTTPLATYSDEALATPNTNPVVADSAGYFAEIYLKTDEQYKFVLYDSDGTANTCDGTVIYTVDDINAGQLVSDAFQTILGYAATNPITYGAVGDGVADEYSYVQSAINAATGVVDLLGKTYRCDSSLTLKSNIVIKNGTLDFTNSADNVYLYGSGTQSTANNLTGNATRGDLTLSVTSATGLAADDWLHLSSNATYDGTYKLGELVQIDSIAALVVTLKAPINGSYATADTATTRKTTMIENVTLEDINVLMSTGASGVGYGVYVTYCEDFKVERSTFSGAKAAGVVAWICNDVSVKDSVFEQTAAAGRGVNAAGSHNITVDGNEFRRLGVGVSMELSQWQSRDVWVTDNVMVGVTSGVSIENNVERVVVTGNSIIGDTSGAATAADGIEVNGTHVQIRNNKIWEMGGHGISHDPSPITVTVAQPWSTEITGNYIADVDNSGIIATDIGMGSISGNTIVDPGEHGISLADSDLVSITGNKLDEVDTAGDYNIYLYTTAGDEIRNVTVTGNVSLRDDDQVPNIYAAGDGAGDLVNLIISGNALENGSYGVGVVNGDADSTIVANNRHEGMGIGVVSGSFGAGAIIREGANTACNTTCADDTCFAGYDDGAPAVVVCTDANADRCVCFP